MPLPLIARGALIGGGVGAVLAVLRSPGRGEEEPGRAARVAKSAAEGALAGAVVGFALDRSLRRRAAEVIAANAPVVLDAATDLARRYEPAFEHLVDAARDRAVDAYSTARPIVVDAYGDVRARALELRSA